jgi:molecular chaperone GrpE
VSEQVKKDEVMEEEVNAVEETVVEELTPEELLQQQVQELETRTLRIQADYDNYRRRTLQEKVEKLLPVFDNLERALQASEGNADFEALKKGLEMVFKQFESTLESEGLTAIPSVGEPFDPNHHQAIMTVDSDEHEEGIVVEEVMKGYKLKDRVIRPAMVKVSN